MYNISICIPTYKRPLMLKTLVLSITKCNLNKALIRSINIIIVDNDVDKSAQKIYDELKDIIDGAINFNYYNYPIKGLSNVRNELIKKSLLTEPDFLVFIDDDEFVCEEWLNELIKTIVANKSDMVSGPVFPKFDIKVSKYIACWFYRMTYENNQKINTIASGNLIINVHSLLKYKVWFDSRFNKTGSEDLYFGKQMMDKGATAYWALNAAAFENISEKRANLNWLIQRWFRGSMSYTYILNLEKEYLKIFRKTLTNIVYIFIGICSLIIIPFPVKKKYWGILKITEGFGGLIGLFNGRYKEYK